MSNLKIDSWDGTKYNKNSSLQFNEAMTFLQQHTFHGHESILDVGCGDGKITVEIVKKVPNGKVIGIDASPNMLKIALQQTQYNNLSFQLQDAQQLEFTNQFDLVTSFFCLQWVPDKLAAFKGIFQALKSNGILLLIVPEVGRLPEITNDLMFTSHWQKYFIDFGDPLITAKDIRYDFYAKQAGFILQDYQIVPITSHFANRQSMCDWLFAVTPHLVRIPTVKEQHLFIENAVDIHLKEFPSQKDGACNAMFTLIKLIGQKKID